MRFVTWDGGRVFLRFSVVFNAVCAEFPLLQRLRTDFLTGTAGNRLGHGGGAARLVLRHMGYDVHGQACLHEFGRVITFVRPRRDRSLRIVQRLARIVDHRLGRLPLRVAIGHRHHRVGDQAVTVVAERVADVA